MTHEFSFFFSFFFLLYSLSYVLCLSLPPSHTLSLSISFSIYLSHSLFLLFFFLYLVIITVYFYPFFSFYLSKPKFCVIFITIPFRKSEYFIRIRHIQETQQIKRINTVLYYFYLYDLACFLLTHSVTQGGDIFCRLELNSKVF